MLLNYQIGSYSPSPSNASLNPSVRLDQIEIESRSGLKTYDYVPITPESLDRVKGLDKRVGEAKTNIKNPDSQLQKVFDIADDYKLSDDVYNNHIVERHGSGGTSFPNKSKFNADYNIKNGINDALTSPDSVVKPNTAGRRGYIFEYTSPDPIGTNPKGKPINTIKVVIDELGNVVTAFPKK